MVVRIKTLSEREDPMIKDARGSGSYGHEWEENKSFQEGWETALYAVIDGLSYFTDAQPSTEKHVPPRLQDFSAKE